MSFVDETHNTVFNFSNTFTGSMPAGLSTGCYLTVVTAWSNGGGASATVTCATMPTASKIVPSIIGTNTTLDFWLIPYNASLSLTWDSSTSDWNSYQILGYSGLSGLFTFVTQTSFSGSPFNPPHTFTFAGGSAVAGDDQILLWGLDPQNSDPWTYANGTGTPGTFTNRPGCINPQNAQTGAQYLDNFSGGGPTGTISLVGTGTPPFITTDYAGIYISAAQAGGGGGGGGAPIFVGQPAISLPGIPPRSYNVRGAGQLLLPATRVISIPPPVPGPPRAPILFAGSIHDPGIVQTGVISSFTPDDPVAIAARTSRTFLGPVPPPSTSPTNPIRSVDNRSPVVGGTAVSFMGKGSPTQVATLPIIARTEPRAADLPPAAKTNIGFGSPLLPATRGLAAAPASYVDLPPKASLTLVASPAQNPVPVLAITAPHTRPPAATSGGPSIAQGAGQPTQNATQVLAPVSAPDARLPPAPTTYAGAGPATQSATFSTPTVAPDPVTLPPATRAFVGFGVPTPSSIVNTTPLSPPASSLPPSDSLFAGAGQPTSAASFTTAPASAPAAILPPSPALLKGVPPIPVSASALVRAVDSYPPIAAGRASIAAGAGQPAQNPTFSGQPALPALAPLPPVPSTVPGVPPIIPTAGYTVQAPHTRPPVLAPSSASFVGFGQAAQNAFIAQAIVLPPEARLPPAELVYAGVAPIVPQIPAFIAPPVLREVVLTTTSSAIRGAGQPAQNPTFASAARAPAPTELPPTASVLAGYSPPPAGVVLIAPPARAVELPPAPAVTQNYVPPPPSSSSVILANYVGLRVVLSPNVTRSIRPPIQPAPALTPVIAHVAYQLPFSADPAPRSYAFLARVESPLPPDWLGVSGSSTLRPLLTGFVNPVKIGPLFTGRSYKKR